MSIPDSCILMRKKTTKAPLNPGHGTDREIAALLDGEVDEGGAGGVHAVP